jgi:L-ascorbate metabolism protein UlaG (beta-lactamase superfamily)
MAAKIKPKHVEIRTYQVGFGDCFLLTFKYPRFDRNVLVDFGSMRLPDGSKRNYMQSIAKEIKKDCGGTLDVVVATHRHKDHISGFATNRNGTGPGDIIASCNPKLVVQPWTENPKAAEDATSAARTDVRGFVDSLENMHLVAETALKTAKTLRRAADREVIEQLEYLGSDNIANRKAVENLMQMGKNKYVKHGDTLPLAQILPGVKVHVLGPPSLEQSKTIGKQRRTDAEEFWHLQALTGEMASTDGDDVLFPEIATKTIPISARWFRIRMRRLRAEMMLSIVRILDKQMNNTSLILLFETGGKSLLFPGDAQIENWLYALSNRALGKA